MMVPGPHVHGERAYHTGISLGGHGPAPRETSPAEARKTAEKAPLGADPVMEG